MDSTQLATPLTILAFAVIAAVIFLRSRRNSTQNSNRASVAGAKTPHFSHPNARDENNDDLKQVLQQINRQLSQLDKRLRILEKTAKEDEMLKESQNRP